MTITVVNALKASANLPRKKKEEKKNGASKGKSPTILIDKTVMIILISVQTLGTLSKNDGDGGSENVGKKMNLRSFKLNRVYLDPLNMSNAGDFSWS